MLAAYQALADVDVIHDHTILGPLVAGQLPDVPPVVATNHGPFTAEARLIYQEIVKQAAVVAISHSQRASAPEIPIAATIHHGIDLDAHAYGDRQAGCRLLVISKMREPDERAYYEREVRPLLGDDVELLDELSAPERIAVLRSATAVLNPICWPEPFGLVMAEALACGTPVLAFPNGAAPEIIEDGRTGSCAVTSPTW